MALTKVKPGGIHADLSSAISGSANASAISGSHTSGFEFAGTVSGSSISTGSFGRVEVAGDLTVTGTGQGWVKISQTNLGGPDADVSSVEFTSGIDSTYDIYRITLLNVHIETDDKTIQMEFSTDGGSNWDAVSKVSTAFRVYGDSTLTTSSEFDLSASTNPQGFVKPGNDADQAVSGEIMMYGFSDTTYMKHYVINAAYSANNDTYFGSVVYGICDTTSAINAVRFTMNSGNIDDGTFTLYGLTK